MDQDKITVSDDSVSHTKKSTKAGKVFNILTTTLCIIILISSIFIVYNVRANRDGMVGPSIFGVRMYIGLTGSMEPTIVTGALIVSKEKPADKIEVGDILSYRSYANSDVVVTHRVVEIDESAQERLFYTKGDNNGSIDERPIEESNLLGVAVFYVNAFPRIATPQGIAIIVVSIILLFVVLPTLIKLILAS